MAYSKTVEFLCTFDSKSGICNSISNVKSLLSTSAHISIPSGNKIKWKSVDFSLDISRGDISGETDSIFYHFIFTNAKEENSEKFQELLKTVRTIISKFSNENEPLTLRDDISSSYATQAYPIIHELENAMRKLITKFMITKVGRLSITRHLPGEVVDSVKSSGKKSITENFLYKTDFIQLSNFLFREFSTHNSESINSIISKATTIGDEELKQLKNQLPMSNWDRYFKPIIKCSSDELKVGWEQLYELRCIVAHNNFMSKEDFIQLKTKAHKILGFITSALDRLSEVEVKEVEKIDILDGVNININEQYGQFLLLWKSIERSLLKIATMIGFNENINPRISSNVKMINYVVSRRIFDDDVCTSLDELRAFRNNLIHIESFENTDLEKQINKAYEMNSFLKDMVNDELQMKSIQSFFETNGVKGVQLNPPKGYWSVDTSNG